MTTDPADVHGARPAGVDPTGRPRKDDVHDGNGRGARTEHGYATVWTMAAAVCVLAVGLTGLLLGQATVARHRAQDAADLGALAGASLAAVDPEGACALAAQIVSANGATETECRVDGFDVTVTVTTTVPGAFREIGPASASARAGPVTSA